MMVQGLGGSLGKVPRVPWGSPVGEEGTEIGATVLGPKQKIHRHVFDRMIRPQMVGGGGGELGERFPGSFT